MILAFYKVNNSQDYDRHTFDMWCDRPQVIKEMLSKLSDDELRIYDLDNEFDYDYLQEDYNDEILDGGWWCVAFKS